MLNKTGFNNKVLRFVLYDNYIGWNFRHSGLAQPRSYIILPESLDSSIMLEGLPFIVVIKYLTSDFIFMIAIERIPVNWFQSVELSNLLLL